MNTTDIYVFLAFLILLVPFGIIWFVAFRSLKKYIKSALNYAALILFSLIGMSVYYMLIFALATTVLNGSFSHLIAAACFATTMFCNLLIVPALLLTLILTVVHYIKKANT